MTVQHFTSDKVESWYKRDGLELFLGDVLVPTSEDKMNVGFGRYRKKGEHNKWVVTYDETLIITKGALIVRSADGDKTAKAGEVIFLTKGTEVVYEAAVDDTELVYVTLPAWMEAQKKSEHAALLDTFSPGTPTR